MSDAIGNGAIRDYGDRALLVECDSTDEVLRLTEALRSQAWAGVAGVVPGARTVLVEVADGHAQREIRDGLSAMAIRPRQPVADHPHADMVIDVVYDGADLDEVSRLTGLTVGEVVAAHTATPWRVAFSGFAPGFAYLTGGDERLAVPRRGEPRTRVPAGAVGLAGEFSGIYPRESPGGWQLIGSTRAALWDLDRSRPALLTPGMWVRFRSVSR
ncbi:MAG: allophanate hydrolase subunit 1 [Mycobacteriaceae bacterium]